MAINIRNVLELLQQKEHEVTSSTSTDDLITLFKAAKKGAGAVIRSYDSDGLLPDATTTTERIAFSEAVGELRFNNNGQWDYIVSGTEIPPPPVYSLRGTNYGYNAGGRRIPAPYNQTRRNVLDKFSFVSEGNATSVGSLDAQRADGAGVCSLTYGYMLGGSRYSTYEQYDVNHIEKYPFTSEHTYTNVGTLTNSLIFNSGQMSNEYGYSSGGRAGVNPPGAYYNNIYKFPFVSDGTATDVGDVTHTSYSHTGQSSITHGYTSTNTATTGIGEFPFASDGNAIAVGQLSVLRFDTSGHQSLTHGYNSGGWASPNNAAIDKFPFASGGTSTAVGDLLSGREKTRGGNSAEYKGYMVGGNSNPSVWWTNIESFPFVSDASSVKTGDLTDGRGNVAASHY
jgi:hypothetical protein